MSREYMSQKSGIHKYPEDFIFNQILKLIYISDRPYQNTSISQHEFDEENNNEVDVLLGEPEIQEPPMYTVVMFNDDYTPMDFVVFVLISEFRHSEEQAIQIMLNIHNKGKGIAGIYPKDIAETKAHKVNNQARREGFPLMTQIEPNKK